MQYNFEKMAEGSFQVRLNGLFVCFSPVQDPKHVDGILRQHGYKSREEFHDIAQEKTMNRHRKQIEADKKQRKEIDFEMMKRTLETIELGHEPAASHLAAIALQSVYNPSGSKVTYKNQEREG